MKNKISFRDSVTKQAASGQALHIVKDAHYFRITLVEIDSEKELDRSKMVFNSWSEANSLAERIVMSVWHNEGIELMTPVTYLLQLKTEDIR